jgi:uncharacterized protein (TIGR03435 family)
MRKPLSFALFLPLALAGAALAQTPAGPAFEVASIKPAPPISQLAQQIQSGKLHVGVSIDGARVDFAFVSLADLIVEAYKIKPFQLTGPDWMKQERFDVLAKLPDGASKDQVPEMLQALLAERFKLSIHRDTKEQAVYALVVGKNGLKMKESPPDADKPAADAEANSSAPGPGGRGVTAINTPEGQFRIRQEGRGAMISGGPNGNMRMSIGDNGNMHMEMSRMGMPQLADLLTRFMDRPVVDMTELKGNYQVALELPMQELMNMARALAPELAGAGAPGAPGPGAGGGPGAATPVASDPAGTSMFQAVQLLGLRLESRKAPMESIVVDHVEKTPTEN